MKLGNEIFVRKRDVEIVERLQMRVRMIGINDFIEMEGENTVTVIYKHLAVDCCILVIDR